MNETFLIQFLNDYFNGDFKNIHDVAGNKHLVGYSNLYNENLFIKIFIDESMFYAEQHVNQVYYPEIYLDSVIYEDNYVVVLKDRELFDIDQELNEERAYKYGTMIANFHNKLTNNVSVKNDTRRLSEIVDEDFQNLKNTEYEKKVSEAYEHIQRILQQVDNEYELLPKVVLHGDFSLRNIKKYKDNEVLIDFEHSRMGSQYEDFIKFFFNEVVDVSLRNEFLKGYRDQGEFEIPSSELQQVLLFKTAIEIYLFHLSHPKKKFGKMADMMIQTILNNDAVLKI
ncbi:hypothetical protein FC40_GL000639 [Ligilactobacillus hayakitensis DSM 18933 = JCM 14209]|uniref:Aminoglycoside phosphotransferase domain-containing protein n=1 Tax=Ligilactobacillus hayakitensis DSM 18933 = JCM 14209 TaxID=1423755 RepID=A0A0R1WUS8_9LACO|nr:phosphotransferase [Ligilactobacillus hayakitensis]KRM18854.1 hypothetical protein FC40_GL000639 [Ligilactobacillus hayakitensis DSM 18933 = JCM 14209]